MGRKKRTKVNPEEDPATIAPDQAIPTFAPPPDMPPPPPAGNLPPPPVDPRIKEEPSTSIQIKSATIRKVPAVELDEADMGTKPSSMYGLHSHAGDLVEDDIYVSDGSLESESEDEQDESPDGEGEGGTGEKKKAEKPKLELLLTTSKMGLMRRGGISSLLGQPVNRTWVRTEQTEDETKETEDTNIKQEEEEEITDPALLLQMQQRKIEQAKQNARILESSENAGRDPCLFSKRTAFDIRMDQIEDKPWNKQADITDYMNYGLTEEDWIEYAERQLAVRQELTDAAKQKRLPDPGIVPVVPRAPTKQGDRVAVRIKKTDENEEEDASAVATGADSDDEDGMEMVVETGPKSGGADEKDSNGEDGKAAAKDASGAKSETSNGDATALAKIDKVVGGAWGAGAKEDSMLLKLIQEQSGQPPMMGGPPMMGMPTPNMMPPNMPPPPPPMMQQGLNDGNWRRDMHQGHPGDDQWRHNQQGPPNDRGRFDGPGRDHPESHWDQQHSSPNFRQQPPPFRGGRGDFHQWGPGRGHGPPMGGRGRGPPMGGRGFGPGRGGPPQWDNRKRPRDFDRGGRW